MERVRAIRYDERNLYEKIKDIFTTASDYEKTSESAKEFFQTIQNKFHYAIVGMTSPEILIKRVDSNKPALGMTHYTKKNITISEASVGKIIFLKMNYENSIFFVNNSLHLQNYNMLMKETFRCMTG